MLNSLSLISVPAFQSIIKIFDEILKGFHGVVFRGGFSCTGCRRWVKAGVGLGLDQGLA